MSATGKDGLKVAKLIKVESDVNSNKFYHMFEQADGTFKAVYGRVGVTPATKIYPMSDWNKKYNEKLSSRKGYVDKTELFAEADLSAPQEELDITDKNIKKLIESLMDYANESIKRNYTVTAESVTQKQIDEAQAIIDEVTKSINKLDEGESVSGINKQLQNLYAIIPRRMKRVSEHLFNESDFLDMEAISWGKKLIQEEQETLDVMAGQVVKTTKNKKTTSGLANFGIDVENVSDKEVEMIKGMLGRNSNQFVNAWKVSNLKTQPQFEKNLKTTKNKQTKLLWHGSRNQNWWNILKMGLVLRPAAVITGKMFGYGIYFADKAQKSIGYTSLQGSYWASGSEKKAYLALFEVHTGKHMHSQRHQGWMSSLDYKKLRDKGEYDSLFAEGGIDLRNNEYIVYKEEQCTVKYIVEISK